MSRVKMHDWNNLGQGECDVSCVGYSAESGWPGERQPQSTCPRRNHRINEHTTSKHTHAHTHTHTHTPHTHTPCPTAPHCPQHTHTHTHTHAHTYAHTHASHSHGILEGPAAAPVHGRAVSAALVRCVPAWGACEVGTNRERMQGGLSSHSQYFF